MFHTGDLNSGINKALAESKLVACFVTNGNEESRLWENDFLKDSELSSQLQERTVLLRLDAGSEEANYLAAIFPIPKVPTLVAIWNGELKEYLTAGITKDDFLTRLGKALESALSQRNVENVENVENDHSIESSGMSNSQNSEKRTTEGQGQESSSGPSTGDSEIGSTSAVQSTHNNAPEPSSPVSHPTHFRGNSPEDANSALGDHLKQTGDTTNYAAMQKKRQQEAKEERARILALVESDKARRRKEAERKANSSDQLTEQSASSHEKDSFIPAPAPKTQNCALQIRLFDGSSIRSKFPNASTLSGDVRKWIDDHQKEDTPYIFKHVCSPLPNKTLSMTDESQDLASLGLYPSATLIIVPVQAYTSAYEGTKSSGVLSRGIAAGYDLGSWGINRVLTTLGGVIGGPAVASDTNQRSESSTSVAGGRASNLRTLKDQKDDDDHHELYNGNTLNFEPRKDVHDGDD